MHFFLCVCLLCVCIFANCGGVDDAPDEIFVVFIYSIGNGTSCCISGSTRVTSGESAQVVLTSVGSSDDTAASIGVTSGRCDCFVLCV